MSARSEIRFNKRSSKRMGWHPMWFGASQIDEILVQLVRTFQRDNGLQIDGLVGPITFSRIVTKMDSVGSDHRNAILYRGQYFKIGWNKVRIDLIRPGNYTEVKKERKITMAVTHWDVTTSASLAKKILEGRGISTGFVIDDDGTIVQLVDINNIAWHAGTRKVNKVSVGIDFNNAYYTKYQKYYIDKGEGPRPVLIDTKVHGVRLKPHLGFREVQINAYKALLRALNSLVGLPLRYPTGPDGKLWTKVHDEAKKGKFPGVVNHYNLTRGKIDTAGLKLDEIIEDIKRNS